MGPTEALISGIKGCLLAAAIGDAPGAPFEGSRDVHPAELSAWAASDRPLRFTDDTAMLLTLAEYLADARGSFDEGELARRFALAWRDEPWRGYGAGPPAIFRRLLAGEHWAQAARIVFPGGSFGNGAAMRVAPVGLLDTTLERVAIYARRSGTVTHAHPLALDGAVAQAIGVALAVRSRGRDEISARDFVTTIDRHMQTAAFIDRLGQAVALVDSASGPDEVSDHLGSDVRAIASVPAAITAFLSQPNDISAALHFAIHIGGDTDTIAAMTGALAGARNGIAGLQPRWLARLEQRERLVAVAARMTR